MKNIYQNPYRIIGILSNATAREIQARKGKIQAFTRVGKPVDSEYDFSFLEDITRDDSTITKAFSDIEQNIDKVKHSLFWFINHSGFDQMALEHLKNGDTSKAKEIWHKLTNGLEINARNFSAYNNIATLWLLSEEEMPKVSGIQYKIKLIESDYFTDFVHLVADETYNIDKNKQIEIFIDEVLKGKNISSQILIQQLSGYAKTYLTQKATEGPIYSIETAVESCEEKRRKDKSNTYRYAKELYTNTQKPLTELKNIAGKENLLYKKCADDVAKEILQCSIDLINEQGEKDKNAGNKSLELLNLLSNINTNQSTKERINENKRKIKKHVQIQHIKVDLEAIQKLVENEETTLTVNSWRIKRGALNGILGIGFINDTYLLIRYAKPHLLRIREVMSEKDYLQVSSNVVNKAIYFVVETLNDELETLETESIFLGDININSLKGKLKDAWRMMYLIDTLDMNHQAKQRLEENKEAIKEMCNQYSVPLEVYDYPKIPRLDFLIVGSEITNRDEDNQSLPIKIRTKTLVLDDKRSFDYEYIYLLDTKYIGLKLEIINNLEADKEITFHIKYIDGNINHLTSQNSPEGYTKSMTTTINKETTVIDLGDWRNGKKRTFDEHGGYKIEVYMEDVLIYTKKIDIHLTSEQQKLYDRIWEIKKEIREIEKTEFYKDEIEKIENKIIELEKFVFFRKPSTKNQQIAEQIANKRLYEEKARIEKPQRIAELNSEMEKLKEEMEKVELNDN